jgi:hypothetical protein
MRQAKDQEILVSAANSLPDGASDAQTTSEGFEDCDESCSVQETLGHKCGKACTKIKNHGGSHYCSVHGAY